ncbi:hypothetical protein [Alcanivorax sp.]|uniref:hypothetical protein n=1 Tax=Alcanivorax sp. TaxID=1872427 RepID=UPI00258A0605|nr:hypothetical protein [Alcanivorax sp.]
MTLRERRSVVVADRPWIPAEEMKVKRETPWPQGDMRVVINKSFYSMSDVAASISSLTGVAIEVAPEVSMLVSSALMGASAGTPVSAGAAPVSPVGGTGTPPPTPTAPTGTPAMPIGGVSSIHIQYDGSLKGLLNMLAGRYGLSWKRIDDTHVRLYGYETRTWHVAALLGELSQTDKVENGSSDSAITSQSVSVWKGIEEAVKSMLSPGGKAVISEATGTITVTDVPAVIERVNEFMEKQNASLSTTVAMDVTVYVVQSSRGEDYAFDWDAVYQTLAANAAKGTGASISLSRTTQAITGGSEISIGVIGNSEWNGTKAILKALSTQGTVTQVSSTRLLTLNGQPIPFKVGQTIAYLKSSSTSVSNGTATTSVEQGTADTGFFLNLLPHVVDKDALLLQFALNLSTLDKLNTVTSGGVTVQTPETSSREMIQRVALRSGQTLMIAGQDVWDVSALLSGVGKPTNALFGGSNSSKDNHSMLVVVIRPVIQKGVF